MDLNDDREIWEKSFQIILKGEIDNYLERNLCGGNLHIVLEDLNFEREYIEYCYQRCLEEDDVQGTLICELLLKMQDPEKFLSDIFEV